MQHIKKASFIFIITLFFFGCKDSGTLSPQEETPTITYLDGQPLPPSVAKKQTTLKLNGIMGTILYQLPYGTKPSSSGHASFGTPPNTIDVGTVTVNNDTLYKSNLLLGNTFYTSFSFDFRKPRVLDSLEFNGAIHTWSVSGNEIIAGFQTSIQSPSDFTILQPQRGATISASQGLTLEWSDGSNSTDDNVFIIISSPSTDRTTYPPKFNTVFKEVPNTGKYTFLSNELIEIADYTTIQIVKFNHKIVTQQQNNYLVVSRILKSVDVVVK